MAGKLKLVFYLICAFFLCFFVGTSVIRRAQYNLFLYGDGPKITGQQTLLLIVTSLLLLSGFSLIIIMGRKLDRYGSPYIIAGILAGSILVQILFVLLLPTVPTADQAMVQRLAKQILAMDYSSLQKGGYLYMHPNNLGITLFLSFLYLIFPQSIFVLKFVNILFATLTSLSIYLLYKEFKGKRGTGYGILITACLFLPSIFLNNFLYNDVIATSLFTGSVLFAVKYVKQQKVRYILLSSCLLSIGNFLREIGLVFLIALVLYLFLHTRSLKNGLIAILVMLLLFKLPFFTVSFIAEQKGMVSEPIGKNSAPALMWIHMGISEDKLGFWDNGASYEVYTRQADWDKQTSIKLFQQKIIEKMNRMGFMNLLKMYYDKVFWTWTEGTYQSEYYGIGHHFFGGYLYKAFATQLLKDGCEFRNVIRWILYCLNFLLLFLAGYRLFGSIKRKELCDELPVLIILGFIAVYLLWEIKSRYIYPCFPYMILLAYMGLEDILSFLKVRILRQGNAV